MKKWGINSVHIFLSVIFFVTSLQTLQAVNKTVTEKKNGKAVIEKRSFGKLSDGRMADIYYLRNDKGMEARITNLGATVVSLTAPGKDGKFEDVVFGFDKPSGYEKSTSYFGSIVGRYGNRIAKGKMMIDGKEYQLALNNGKNHLHGGKTGFDKKLWKAEKTEMTSEGPALTLSMLSKNGDENYPGNLTVRVVYTLKNDNSLVINIEGTTDKTTVFNPTNHSYFNLTGDPNKTILGHELEIKASKFTPVDEGLIPTGVLENVEGTPMDFRKAKKIGRDIGAEYLQLKYGLGYDHNWVLDNYNGTVQNVASLYEPESGRLMEVLTDEPGIQFYCGNFLNGSEKGKKGTKYNYRTALALETQHFPDSPNQPQFPSTLLKPGEVYKQTTVYRFSVK